MKCSSICFMKLFKFQFSKQLQLLAKPTFQCQKLLSQNIKQNVLGFLYLCFNMAFIFQNNYNSQSEIIVNIDLLRVVRLLNSISLVIISISLSFAFQSSYSYFSFQNFNKLKFIIQLTCNRQQHFIRNTFYFLQQHYKMFICVKLF